MFKELIYKTEDPLVKRLVEHLVEHLVDLNSENKEISHITLTVYPELIHFSAEKNLYNTIGHYPQLNIQKELCVLKRKTDNLFILKACKYNIANTESLINNLGNPRRNLLYANISWEGIYVRLIKNNLFSY